MNDPLNPGPVKATDSLQNESDGPATYDDARPWFLRLLTSLRPSISREKIVRTGKTETEIEVKGHIDFW